ncbi:hypothetical protein GPA19_12100 [Azoarcus indigens]|nr:hypothetical protein [Azoarcus indigens]
MPLFDTGRANPIFLKSAPRRSRHPGRARSISRGWRGFHHHATLCIAAYGFLVAERLRHKDTKKCLIRPATCLTRKLHAAGQFNAPSGTFPIRSRHYGGSSLRR